MHKNVIKYFLYMKIKLCIKGLYTLYIKTTFLKKKRTKVIRTFLIIGEMN